MYTFINLFFIDLQFIYTKLLIFFFLPPVWRHSIFLEYLWCREYGGIRSLRVNQIIRSSSITNVNYYNLSFVNINSSDYQFSNAKLLENCLSRDLLFVTSSFRSVIREDNIEESMIQWTFWRRGHTHARARVSRERSCLSEVKFHPDEIASLNCEIHTCSRLLINSIHLYVENSTCKKVEARRTFLPAINSNPRGITRHRN